jgi:hypothetical protein
MIHDALVLACREDTRVLTSLEGVIKEQQGKIMGRMLQAERSEELWALKGELKGLNTLLTTIKSHLHNRAAA